MNPKRRLLAAADILTELPGHWAAGLPPGGISAPTTFALLRETHEVVRRTLAALGPETEDEPDGRDEDPRILAIDRVLVDNFKDRRTMHSAALAATIAEHEAMPLPPGLTWVGVARTWVRAIVGMVFSRSLSGVPLCGYPDPEGRRAYALAFFERHCLLFDDETRAAVLDSLSDCVATDIEAVAALLYAHPSRGRRVTRAIDTIFTKDFQAKIKTHHFESFPDPGWDPDPE
ncbi:MAG: hypothetical protein KC933_01520 [Myxococcales bacterium]|nr:hypothetical protein [Myxococcales bacterium]MCA9548682.1 hypothetical protein [Myxococcales bacterium]MCB9651868.1 hypothetical protein [Deltaproteobacteria bacterium]